MKRNFLPSSLLSATFLLGCSGDGDQIEAYVQYRVEFPDDVADTLELPALLTLSLGHEGKEEVTAQKASNMPSSSAVFSSHSSSATTCNSEQPAAVVTSMHAPACARYS